MFDKTHSIIFVALFHLETALIYFAHMNFAYLNLKNHPRGNIILQHLIKTRFLPSVIIEENSSLAAKSRNSIISTFKNSSENFLLTKDIIVNQNIFLTEVENHNDKQCEDLLKKFDLDLIILGDTRIIKKNIMDIPKIGTINSHPGYLPDVKGNHPYIWAIINDLPQGCSIHFIDENVDTGDVLLREIIDLKKCESYIDLIQKINYLCADLMIKAVKQIINKTYVRTPQSKLKFAKENHIDQEFYAAAPEIKEAAIRKLEGIKNLI